MEAAFGPGKYAAEAAFHAWRCTSMLDFLSRWGNWAKSICTIFESVMRFDFMDTDQETSSFWFHMGALRAQEEARETGSFVRFLGALPTTCAQMVLKDAEFASENEFSALFQAIASPPCTLHSLDLSDIKIIADTEGLNAKRIIGDMLLTANNSTLQSLSILVHLCSQEDLLTFLTHTSSLESLTIHLEFKWSLDDVFGILAALANNTISLVSLALLYADQHQLGTLHSHRQLGDVLLTNTSLKALDLYELPLPGGVVSMILSSLEKNNRLTYLSLTGCRGEYWPSANFVLDCLRINGILSELDLIHTPLQGLSAAAINAQLARNAENAKQVKLVPELELQEDNIECLKSDSDEFYAEAGVSFMEASFMPQSIRHKPCGVIRTEPSGAVRPTRPAYAPVFKFFRPACTSAPVEACSLPPTSARLFLCGLPYSGKTTLVRSLAKRNTKRPRFPPIGGSVLERTQGIQVTTVEKDGVKVSLWDLAGQSEYFALHDYMLPNLSSEPRPSMFLFVWNPIEVDETTGHARLSSDGTAKKKTSDMFKDELRYWLRFLVSKSLKSVKFKPILCIAITRKDQLEINMRTWIEDKFNQCQEEFKAYIQLDMESVFTMDARYYRHEVQDLASHIFNFAEKILSLAPPTYNHQACDTVRTELARMRIMDPLVRKEDFFSLCKKWLGKDSEDLQLESIALSLNDSGDIIYFESCDLVVIDTQWFCHDIMGDLINFRSNHYHTQGRFEFNVLKDLLESKVKPPSTRIRSIFAKPHKIAGEELVKLLIGLRLAYQQDGSSDIFVPTCLSVQSRNQIRPSTYFKGDRGNMKTFMGRRLKCKDLVCTFFTPGIFSFLQISLQIALSDLGVNVTLEKDVIAFGYQGFEVFLEACGQQGLDHFIDVLISSPQGMDSTVDWVQENILIKVEKICANPRGIQGVELAHEVIRPSDVEHDRCAEERTQSISVEKLKAVMEEHLEKTGSQLEGEHAIRNVRYTWQRTRDSNFVAALLGEKETLLLVQSYLRGLNAAVQDACLSINMEEGETPRVTKAPLPDNAEQEPSDSSNAASKSIQSEIQEMGARLMKHINIGGARIEKRIDIMGARLENKMDNLCSEIKKTHDAVLESLLKVWTVLEAGEAGKLPRMYVVTRDDGRLMHKMAAAIVPGLHSMRLKLLCERTSKPHLVGAKPGLSLATLDDGLVKNALPYVNAFLKVAHLAVKVGAHVAAGIGNSIPDFTHVLSLIADTDGAVPASLSLPEPMGEPSSAYRSVSYQEGRQWLCDVLSKHDCRTGARIHEVFGLRRVQYRDQSKVVVWLCDDHKSEGVPMPL